MKKLFVLFLLVALVPFTVGCGLFGDNDDTSPITTSTLTLSRLFPAGSFTGSLRGATTTTINISYTDLFMNITVNGTKIKLNYKKHTNKTSGVEVEFSAPVVASVIQTINTNDSVVAEVQAQNTVIVNPIIVVPAATLPVTVELPLTGTSSTAATALESTPITTVKTDAEIVTEIKKENPTITEPVIPTDYMVSSTLFGTIPVSQTSTTPTPITAASSYVFTVTLNKAYGNTASPTFTVSVDNINTTADAQNLTGAPITVAWDSTKTIATVTVTPTTTYKLTIGQTYSINLVSTDATSTDGAKAILPTPYYIKIQ